MRLQKRVKAIEGFLRMIDIDCLVRRISLIPFGEKRIHNLYHLDGALFVLWSAASDDRLSDKGTRFGITRLQRALDGSVIVDSEFVLHRVFGKSSSVYESFQHHERLIFVVEESFSDASGWGTHRFIFSFSPLTTCWQEAVERLPDGALRFSGIDSSNKSNALTRASVILFCDQGLLKCGFDYTPYHLDDWERNDDSGEFSIQPESREERMRRESRLLFRVEGKRKRKQVESFHIPLVSAHQRLVANVCATGEELSFVNLKERLLRDFPRTCSAEDALRAPKEKIKRSGRPQTVPWNLKEGVPLVGKLSDLTPLRTSDHPGVTVVPEVTVEGVVCCGKEFRLAAINVLLTRRANLVAAVELPAS